MLCQASRYDPNMCSTPLGSSATDDAVRALTVAVRALPAAGRGVVAAAEAEALLGLVDAATVALLERVAVIDVDGVCQDDVDLTAAAWLRRRARSSREDARRTVRLARRLHTDPDRVLPVAGEALAAGDLTTAQVQAIADVTAVAPVELVAPLEEALVARAGHLGADELRRVGKDLVDRLTAAHDDAPDRRERERGGCYLRTHDTIFGRIAIEGILSAEVGTLLRAVLDPLAAPAATTDSGGARVRDPRTTGERLHDALGEVLAIAAASEATPGQGGSAPHVQVLVDADALISAAAGTADSGQRSSAGPAEATGPAARTLDGLPLTPAETDRPRLRGARLVAGGAPQRVLGRPARRRRHRSRRPTARAAQHQPRSGRAAPRGTRRGPHDQARHRRAAPCPRRA